MATATKEKEAEKKVAAPLLLKQKYRNEVIPALMEKFKYKNIMSVPKLTKISLNMGLGMGMSDKKVFEQGVSDLTQISGQKAVLTKARKAVSNFKVRLGWTVGARVTLHGRNMYEFLYRFINVALPRVPDFRGVNPKSFDGNGNFSLGMKELVVFPEINPDKSTYPLGMDVTIVTSAKTDEEGRELLRLLGLPFQA